MDVSNAWVYVPCSKWHPHLQEILFLGQAVTDMSYLSSKASSHYNEMTTYLMIEKDSMFSKAKSSSVTYGQ